MQLGAAFSRGVDLRVRIRVDCSAQEANGGHAGKVRLLKSRQRRGGQRLARGVRRLATRLVAASRVVMGVSERGSGDAASLAGP